MLGSAPCPTSGLLWNGPRHPDGRVAPVERGELSALLVSPAVAPQFVLAEGARAVGIDWRRSREAGRPIGRYRVQARGVPA